jgi:hypothetical protein
MALSSLSELDQYKAAEEAFGVLHKILCQLVRNS